MSTGGSNLYQLGEIGSHPIYVHSQSLWYLTSKDSTLLSTLIIPICFLLGIFWTVPSHMSLYRVALFWGLFHWLESVDGVFISVAIPSTSRILWRICVRLMSHHYARVLFFSCVSNSPLNYLVISTIPVFSLCLTLIWPLYLGGSTQLDLYSWWLVTVCASVFYSTLESEFIHSNILSEEVIYCPWLRVQPFRQVLC